jgi:hypothetical protein
MAITAARSVSCGGEKEEGWAVVARGCAGWVGLGCAHGLCWAVLAGEGGVVVLAGLWAVGQKGFRGIRV